MSPVKSTTLTQRVEEAESRLDEHEKRLDKYDAIIVRLDVLIDVLSKRVETTATKADTAIDGQGVLEERNEHAHRWAALGIALGSSSAVGLLMFILGYVVHH